MNNIQILRGADSRPAQQLTPDDSFVCTLKQMGEQSVRMTVSAVQPLDLRAGDYFDWQGVRYTLADEPDYKRSEGTYTYTLAFYAPYHRLSYLLHKDEGSLAFPYDGNLEQQIDALYTSIGREASGFTVDIEPGIETAAEFRHIEFDKTYCLDALTRICEEFGTEWHIAGQAIRIGRFETAPAGLFRYGRGKGLYSLEKIGVSDASVVTRLYGFGSSDNLPEGYRAQTLEFSGVGGKSYLEKNVDKYGIREETVAFDDIYPHLEGATLSGVTVPSDIAKATGWTVTMKLPADCNDIVIEKDKSDPQIKFTSGALMGESFTITGLDAATGRLDFNTSEDNGYKLPSQSRQPAVGDGFVLLGIVMPQSYVDRAEAELKARTQEELDRRCEKQYAYRLDIDPRYVRSEEIRVRVGDTLLVQESDETEPVEIRVSEVSYPLQDPEKLSLVLSDTPVYTSYSEKIENDIEDVETKVEEVHKNGVRFSRRLWRDALQTMEMLRKGLKDYTDSTRPIAVNTMQLLVGDESLQFRFVASRQSLTVVSPVSYNERLGRLEVASATLQHLTLGNREITSHRDPASGLFWDMPLYNSPLFGYEERDESYYLYARVPRNPASGSGTYRLEREPVEMEQESGFYHLLVGILNSETDGSRSYTDLYGFTEITPGRITADRIVSQDGLNFMDFVNNSFRIGNSDSSLEWNTADQPRRLALRNSSFEISNGSKSMVRFDGQSGAGHVAGGKLRWDTQGNLTATSGIFNDIVINGSFRNAFRDGKYVMNPAGSGLVISTPGLQDNNNVVIPGTSSGGWVLDFEIPFEGDAIRGNYNGFRATIVNDDFGGQRAVGYISASAPTGKYFFENGKRYTSLTIAAKEGVELLGFGEGDQLRGWAVLNRFYVGDKTGSGTTPVTPVLCSGHVTANGDMQTQWGHVQCLTEKDAVRGNGCYRITHNLGHLDYYVQLTPFNNTTWHWYKVHGVILEKNANDVLVAIIDSGTDNRGQDYDFEFCITGRY